MAESASSGRWWSIFGRLVVAYGQIWLDRTCLREALKHTTGLVFRCGFGSCGGSSEQPVDLGIHTVGFQAFLLDGCNAAAAAVDLLLLLDRNLAYSYLKRNLLSPFLFFKLRIKKFLFCDKKIKKVLFSS